MLFAVEIYYNRDSYLGERTTLWEFVRENRQEENLGRVGAKRGDERVTECAVERKSSPLSY